MQEMNDICNEKHKMKPDSYHLLGGLAQSKSQYQCFSVLWNEMCEEKCNLMQLDGLMCTRIINMFAIINTN